MKLFPRVLAGLLFLTWLAAVPVAFSTEPTLAELVERLNSPEQLSRENALYRLTQMGGHAREAVPAIATLLKDPAESVRSLAALALGRIGQPFETSGPVLLAALDDPAVSVRISAAQSLRNMNWERVQVIQKLLPLSGHEFWSLRVAVADGLWSVREVKDQPELEQTVSTALIKMLSDPYPLVRSSAARSLAGLKIGAEASVPALILALDDKDWRVRREAAGALGSHGEQAASASDGLVKHLSDPDSETRVRAAQSLRAVNPAKSLELLLAAMKSGNELMRSSCVEALGRYGSEEAVVLALANALNDGSADVRFRALRALEGLGLAAKPALEGIIKTVGDRNCIVREYACRTLAKLGPEAVAAAPVLLSVTTNEWHAGTRRAAFEALKAIQPAPAPAAN